MSLLAVITWDDDANFTITLFINPYYLLYVCPVRGFNVSQIKYADCAAFSPLSGFVSLSVHPYFVRQNTERAAKVHFFLHLLSSSPENLPPFCDFT